MRTSMIAFFLLALSGAARAIDVQAPAGWTEASRSNDLVIFYQDDDHAHERNFQAIVDINATPEQVFKVVTDFEAHTKFMPFTKESKIVKRVSANEIIGYQLISPPLVSDRDYYLDVKVTPGSAATGGVFKSEWHSVKFGPDRDGVVRMPLAKGYWLFTPIDGGKHTRITYTSMASLGGSIPHWIANRSTLSVIPKMFRAIRKRLGLPPS